jgi:hypothetical protein
MVGGVEGVIGCFFVAASFDAANPELFHEVLPDGRTSC